MLQRNLIRMGSPRENSTNVSDAVDRAEEPESGPERSGCHQHCCLSSGKVTASECYVMGRHRQSAPQARAVRRHFTDLRTLRTRSYGAFVLPLGARCDHLPEPELWYLRFTVATCLCW